MLFRYHLRLALIGAGALLLLAAGIVTVSAMPPSQEEGPPNLDADYVGTGTCMMCHTQDDVWLTTGHANMVKAPGADTILGDLSDTAAVTITWPDGSERPITAEDITYVLGGRYVQQYVSVIPRDDGTPGYFVLPVQWNIPQSDGPDRHVVAQSSRRLAGSGARLARGVRGLPYDRPESHRRDRNHRVRLCGRTAAGPDRTEHRLRGMSRAGQRAHGPAGDARRLAGCSRSADSVMCRGRLPTACTATRSATSRVCRWTRARSSSPRPIMRRSGSRMDTPASITSTANG